MVIKVEMWDGPHWSQYEFMSDLYQTRWMDITPDKQIIEVWI